MLCSHSSQSLLSLINRFNAWLSALGLLLLVSAALALALASLVPGNPELARRAEASLGDALGVPVTVQKLHWQVWPVPRLVIEGLATVQSQPIRLNRLTLYPGMPQGFADQGAAAHLIRIDRAELEGAELPQLSLRGLGRAEADEASGLPGVSGFAGAFLARLVFRDVNWVSRNGHTLRYEGELDFDDDGRPRMAQLRRAGAQPAAGLQLTRRGIQDQWDLHIELAHGSADGAVSLASGAGSRLRLEGSLQTHQVDAAAAAGTFGLRPLLAGRISGRTLLWADGASSGELARKFQTHSNFDVSDARLQLFDLEKALRTGGRSPEGETALGELTGHLGTVNTGQGVQLNFTDLIAQAGGDGGAMALSGRLRVSPAQRVEARFEVDLLDAVASQPLEVSGPPDGLLMSFPRSMSGRLAGNPGRAVSP